MQYQAKILIGVAVMALIVVAVILFQNKAASNNKQAAELLAKAIPLYEMTSYKEAIEGQASTNTTGLKKIVDDYGSTENGETAKIYLGNAYMMTGKTDDAFKAFDSYSGSNPLFKSTAMAAKAGILQQRNENEKAADLYKDAAKISKTNPANPEYLFEAGVILLKLGKKEEAKSLFDTIKKDYKTSSQFSEADRYLIQIEG